MLLLLLDHERQLFRGRRCRIMRWAPHPEEERLNVDGEWLLMKMPQIIYVLFEDARWTVNTELGTGVYPLAPRYTQVDSKQKNEGVRDEDRLFTSARFRIHTSHDSRPVLMRRLRGRGNRL